MNGNPCVGSTADNNAYRTISIGLLQTNAPAFVVGVYHSASTEVTTTNPVNNATYTSVGAVDGAYNAGATDVSQADIAAVGFTSSSPQLLSGSAAYVLNYLGITPQGSQYAPLLADLPNLYITVFERTPQGSCPRNFCDTKNTFVNLVQTSQQMDPTVGFIPSGDPVFTDRAGLPFTISQCFTAASDQSHRRGGKVHSEPICSLRQTRRIEHRCLTPDGWASALTLWPAKHVFDVRPIKIL